MDRKVLINYIYSILFQIINLVTPLITTPYTSRILKADGIGVYSYTSSIASVFILVASFGVNMYGQREIASHKDDLIQKSTIFWELLLSRALTTIAVLLVYVVFCFAYNKNLAIFLLQGICILAVMFDISWYYQGIEKFKIITIRNSIIKILSILLIFTFVKTSNDLPLYVFLLSISALSSYLIFFFSLKGEIIYVPISKLDLKRHFVGTLQFFIPAIAVQVYSQVDKIMLGALLNDNAENGYYEQARKIVSIVLTIITSINTVLYPRISSLYSMGDHDKIKKMLQESYSIVMFLLIPITIGLWFVSDNFVNWFFGFGYEPVAILIKLSVGLLFFMGVGNFAGMQYLNPTHQQNRATKIYVISAIVNLILNSIFIPYLKSVGAILASIVAEAVSGITQMFLLRRSKYGFNYLIDTWKYIVASIIMAVALSLIDLFCCFNGVKFTILQILIATLVYILTLLIEREKNINIVLKFIKNKVSSFLYM